MERMFNCSESALLKSIHNEALREIIGHYNHVRIPGDNPISLLDYIKDQPDTGWEILDRAGVNVYPNQGFVMEAKEKPALRVEHPKDVFLYDSSSYDDPATNPYGVLAMAGESIEAESLTKSWDRRISVEKDDTGKPLKLYSWKEILAPFHQAPITPSNALVFVDRYLFAHEKRMDVDYKNGVRNIFAILNELLPDTFTGEYQVLFVFDPEKIGGRSKDHKATVIDVIRELQSIKKIIRLGKYMPTFELLPIRPEYDQELYSETHDRRIISNYFTIEASHGFSAILPSDMRKDDITYTGYGEGTWGQKVSFYGNYHGITRKGQYLDYDSLPVSFCDETLRYLHRYYRKSIASVGHVEYICNGNQHCDISQLRNRLITSI